MRGRFFFAIGLAAVLVSACSLMPHPLPPTEAVAVLTEPTSTELPTANTPDPTRAPILTPTLAATLAPTQAPTTLPRTSLGTPVPDWEGVRIMPGANEGRPAGFSYVYSVDVTAEEAEAFYLEHMELDGWALTNRQASETSLYGGPAVTLDFERGDEAYNVMLVFSTSSNYTIVMLTRVKP